MSEKFVLNSNICEVISVVTNESRIRIIFELNRKINTISGLAKQLDLNVQETHRNVNRMMETKVLIKTHVGLLSLSTLGKMIILLFPSFHFVVDNVSFFNAHTFEGMPDKFPQRIEVLQNCKLVSGVVKVLENWSKMAHECDRYMKIVASQAPLEPVEITLQKANKGLKVNLVVGRNTIFPERYPELLKTYNSGKLELNGFFVTKIIDKVRFYLVITDKEASISFTDLQGEVDINKTFFGRDPKFLDWCNELFEHTWKQGINDNEGLSRLFSNSNN